MVRSSMRSSAFRADGSRASRPRQRSSTACRKRADHIRRARGRQPLLAARKGRERRKTPPPPAAAGGASVQPPARPPRAASPARLEDRHRAQKLERLVVRRRHRHDAHAEVALAGAFADRDARRDAGSAASSRSPPRAVRRRRGRAPAAAGRRDRGPRRGGAAARALTCSTSPCSSSSAAAAPISSSPSATPRARAPASSGASGAESSPPRPRTRWRPLRRACASTNAFITSLVALRLARAGASAHEGSVR